jgi:Lon protease-like protein
MNIDNELCDFSGICRLFPLPNVVLFPHVILPLHIFEPRYRQMAQDALDGDRLVTMVQACPLDQGHPWAEPVPIVDVACVGKIVKYDELPDGRYNILLLGCKRVRLGGEVESSRLYRLAEGVLLEDEAREEAADERRRELIELFFEVLQASHRIDPDLSRLLRSEISLGILSDIIAHALDVPASVKQGLLDETRVDRRVDALVSLLHGIIGRGPQPRRFPPPFSLN